jgi:hypothetical protein
MPRGRAIPPKRVVIALALNVVGPSLPTCRPVAPREVVVSPTPSMRVSIICSFPTCWGSSWAMGPVLGVGVELQRADVLTL